MEEVFAFFESLESDCVYFKDFFMETLIVDYESIHY